MTSLKYRDMQNIDSTEREALEDIFQKSNHPAKQRMNIRNWFPGNRNTPPKKSMVRGAVFLAAIVGAALIGTSFFLISKKPYVNPAIIQNATTSQLSSAVALGDAIHYVKIIDPKEVNQGQYLVSLPQQATNVKITKLPKTEALALQETKPTAAKLTNADRLAFSARSPFARIAPKTGSQMGFIPRVLFDIETTLLSANTAEPEPTQELDISQELEEIIEPAVAQTPEAAEEPVAEEVQETPVVEETPTPVIQPEVIAITYDIPAPVIAEEVTDTGKVVTVSSTPGSEAAQAPIIDVVAHTTIPELFRVGQENNIKIVWRNENGEPMPFIAYDLNGNGKIDYLEWTVPHLSEQVFEIIFISKAFQLDSDQNILADIFESVGTQDHQYATITDGQYVRATFDGILRSRNDITLYAKSQAGASIQVFPVYIDEAGNETQGAELVTARDNQNPDFSNITTDRKYRILLSHLPANTSVVDLKITGTVDIDYIVDPSVKIYITDVNDVTFNAPEHWPGIADVVEVIGGGGGGSSSNGTNNAKSGGGGAYSMAFSISVGEGAEIRVGAGGPTGSAGGDTWFNGNALVLSSVGAKGGSGGVNNVDSGAGTPGGDAASGVGFVKYSGGAGGELCDNYGGVGGGGAAGPGGDGRAGGDNCAESGGDSGGGGGGGNGGGGDGSNISSGTDGGTGGISADATPGGAGGSGSTPGAAGSHGSGGGGGSGGGQAGTYGANGGNGVEWDEAHGSGGGGGGSGAINFSADSTIGGNGGLYGGGGGASGYTSAGVLGNSSGGTGGQGIIVVTYTPIPTYSISGTVYSDEGVTILASGQTVAASINGVASGSDDIDGSGQYTITDLEFSAGDVLTLYLDGETEKAVTVTVAPEADMTGIDLYQNNLIARCDNASCSLNNGHLQTAQGSDSDVTDIYSISGSNALTVASGKSLFIPSGHTFAPVFNVTVGGNFINNGTYTFSTEVVTLNGEDGSYEIKMSNSTLHDLTIDAPGSTYTAIDAEDLTVTHNFIIAEGTFIPPPNLTLGTNFTKEAGGTFTHNSGRVIIGIDGTITNTDALYDLLVQEDVVLGAALDVNGGLVIDAGSLDVTIQDYPINVAGSWSVLNGGSFNAQNGLVAFDGSGTQTIIGDTTFYDLTKQETTDDSTNKRLTFTSGSTTAIGHTLTLDGLDSNDKLEVRASSNSPATINFTGASTFSTTGYLDIQFNTITDNSSGITIPLNPDNSTDSGNTIGWFTANETPAITAGPSDGGSVAAAPTNVGSNISFTATATDADGDNYYLAICKTNSVTANNEAAPSCGGGNWGISSSTASGAQASVSYTALIGDASSNAWFAFVCDHNAESACSSAAQGTGNNGSPFVVNHRPNLLCHWQYCWLS